MSSLKMLQMCQMCRQCPLVHRQFIHRILSNMKQNTCTANARVIKHIYTRLQTDPNILGCTFRVPTSTCMINHSKIGFNRDNSKSETLLNRNCDHGVMEIFGDSQANYTFLQEHSNKCLSSGNNDCTNNDSHQNVNTEPRKFLDSKFTSDKQSKYCEVSDGMSKYCESSDGMSKYYEASDGMPKYCVTESTLEPFNDNNKCISSIKHHNAALNCGTKIQKHTCTSVSDHKIKRYSQLQSCGEGNVLNTKRISTWSSTFYFLQNRHNSPVKRTHCMFHTSTRCRLLHTVDDAHDNVDVKLSPPWKVKFFGTDEIAVMTLKALYENMTTSGSLVESIDVVTVPQMHAVHRFAKSVNLPVEVWPIKVEPCKYDVGILVSFGHMIPDSVIHMFPYGILNMHPSLLPRWRGASPIIHTILNDDTTTGVSIMEIRPRHFDIGPLLLQRKIAVPSRCTSYQLLNMLGPFGSSMVLECLKDLPKLERFEHEQNSDGITYAHKLKRSDAYIDWEKHTAEQIDCQYRAVSDLMPLKTVLFGETVKLIDVVDPNLLADISSRDIKGFRGNLKTVVPGTVVYSTKHDCMLIKCKDGFIGFRNIVIKNRISAKDFHNGYIQMRKSCTQFTSFSNNLNKFVKFERIPVASKV